MKIQIIKNGEETEDISFNKIMEPLQEQIETLIAEHGYLAVTQTLRVSLKNQYNVQEKLNDSKAFRFNNAAIEIRNAAIELENYERGNCR